MHNLLHYAYYSVLLWLNQLFMSIILIICIFERYFLFHILDNTMCSIWYGTPCMKGLLTSCWLLKWICKLYHVQMHVVAWADFVVRFCCVPDTLQRAELSRSCISWTKISFIWSTTFSGIWDSKQELRLKGHYLYYVCYM